MKTGTLFGNIINTFSTKAFTAVVNLAIAITLSQYLGPAGKGQQGLIITTITFILVFTNLVGGATLVYLTPRHPLKTLLVPSYIWTLTVALLSYPALYFTGLIDQEFVIHTCILSVFSSFTAIHSSLLIGKEKIKAANLVNLFQPLIIIVVLLVFFTAFKRISIDVYIYSLYFSYFTSFIISLLFMMRVFRGNPGDEPEPQGSVLADLIRFGLWNQAAHITQMLSFRMSYYILDHYHGESAVGVYSNGISLSESIWLVAKSISLVQYARISNTNDRSYARRLTLHLAGGSTIVSLLVLVPMALLPENIYIFIFGEGFGMIRQVIWSLAPGVIVYNLSILFGHYFSGTGRYHINAITSTLGLAVSLAAYYTLIPSWSIVGAGAATSISYIFTTLVFVLYLEREKKGIIREMIQSSGDLKTILKEILKKPGN